MSIDIILEELERVNEKLDRILAATNPFYIPTKKKSNPILGDGIPTDARFPPTEEPTVIEKTIIKGGRTIPKKGQGKYEWFPVNGLRGVKVRKCSNEGCPYYLKYSEEKGKYEHWKFDPINGDGGFVQDNCEYYLVEG